MKLFPAIDMIDQKLVRLTEGDFKQRSYYEKTVLEQVQEFRNFEFKNLHLINLSGTLDPNAEVYELIRDIKKNKNLCLQFGGGLRTIDQIEKLIEIGVDRIILSTIIFQNFEDIEALVKANSQTVFVAALDSKDDEIYIKGWKENTGRKLQDFIPVCVDIGILDFLVTDISKDGKLQGPNVELYQNLRKNFPDLNFVASGGIAKLEDLEKMKAIGMDATVIGKAIYEAKIDLKELAELDKDYAKK